MYNSLQLSATALCGTCSKTKTSSHGQPFACQWHRPCCQDSTGSPLAGQASTAVQDASGRAHSTDHARLHVHKLQPFAEHASRPRPGKLCTQFAAPEMGIAKHFLRTSSLKCTEACQITLRSMRCMLLACAAHLTLPLEHRLSQGYHRDRDSALLYSRNDTFSSLRGLSPREKHGTGRSGTPATAPLQRSIAYTACTAACRAASGALGALHLKTREATHCISTRRSSYASHRNAKPSPPK